MYVDSQDEATAVIDEQMDLMPTTPPHLQVVEYFNIFILLFAISSPGC